MKIPTRLRHALKRVPGLGKTWLNLRVLLAPTFREDGLWTIHNSDFNQDERFLRAADSCRKQLRFAPEVRDARWRWYVAAWCANQAKNVPGEFVDCGAGFGVTAMMIVTYLDFTSLKDRSYYMVDSFGGLDENLIRPNDSAALWNQYDDVFDAVAGSFEELDNVRLVRGFIPTVLDAVNVEAVAFLHIDLNGVVAEEAALSHFRPLLSQGGVVLLDDYGWRGHEAQKAAHDEFAAAQGLQVLSMPTGQGILIKA